MLPVYALMVVSLALPVSIGKPLQAQTSPAPPTAAATPVATASSGPAASPIDFAACENCHEKSIAGFGHTKHKNVPKNCAQCHSGDLAQHAETADPTLVTTPREMPAKDANGTCLTCHENGQRSHWLGSIHDRRNVKCTDCHSVHDFRSTRSQLTRVRAADTCFSCHPAVRAQGLRASHHPVREGKMDCGSCHNPHGSPTPKLIRANSVNELCYTCHTEKRGPFLWEHAPVRESCMNCHQAHGSNHDKLLVAKQPYLCQRCHLNTRHPGTLYDLRNTVPGANASNRSVEHGCRNCHQNVHGTNHPSGPYLGR
jgi:DmsE family decaheme c-type cytochrome